MKLELFNSTNMIKQVPKYNYTGQVRIPAQGVYSIEEYMVPFYRPYAKIGVYVRAAEVKEVVEPEVEKVIPTLTQSESEKPVVPEIPEEVKTEEPITENPVQEEVPVEEKKEEVKKYTEDELREFKVAELKELAATMGIDLGDVKQKAPYIEAILAIQV